MRYRFLLAIIISVVAGCQLPAVHPQERKPVTHYATPVCKGVVQCGQMWQSAQSMLETVTGMRLMFANETIIQTYTANGLARLTGTVTKYPISEDEYQIRLNLECYRYDDCSQQAEMALSLFNLVVAGVNAKEIPNPMKPILPPSQ